MIGKTPGGSQARCVVVFGGIDPGGGAGIAADVRAGSLVGVLVAAIPAVLTVQSTSGLESVRDVDSRWMIAAGSRVFRDQRVGCIKTGAIGGNGRTIAKILRAEGAKHVPVVIDPVILPTLVATGKAAEKGSLSSLRSLESLLPFADLVTPNGPEAERFSGLRVQDEMSAVAAAQVFIQKGAGAVLLKGGHWGPRDRVTDLFVMKGRSPLSFRSKRMELPPVHGGGCTLASLIAAEISSRGHRRHAIKESDWRAIVLAARRRHQKLLRTSIDVGGKLRVLVEAREPGSARSEVALRSRRA
ncbi:MAG: bifunctional hydroxymethylpyrimidine kinase/phosphomethylpyrimidine kinase [Polyangiaceae bacterium]|nr:bifunctional hydroxymethylpyrimidine kinase/phosphomethylpyrimidine kinase [Polyangiaceae bacterium]